MGESTIWAKLANSGTFVWKTVGEHLILNKSDWGVLILPTGIKNWHVFPGQGEMENRGESLRCYQTSEEKLKYRSKDLLLITTNQNYTQSR